MWFRVRAAHAHDLMNVVLVCACLCVPSCICLQVMYVCAWKYVSLSACMCMSVCGNVYMQSVYMYAWMYVYLCMCAFCECVLASVYVIARVCLACVPMFCHAYVWFTCMRQCVCVWWSVLCVLYALVCVCRRVYACKSCVWVWLHMCEPVCMCMCVMWWRCIFNLLSLFVYLHDVSLWLRAYVQVCVISLYGCTCIYVCLPRTCACKFVWDCVCVPCMH